MRLGLVIGTRQPDLARLYGRAVACALLAALISAPTAGTAQPAGPNAPTPNRITSLIGIVGDSLHGGPLAGATILVDGQGGAATTDSIGRFRIDSIQAGLYKLGIFHPILDSLGSTLESRPVKFVAGKPVLLTLATPSGRTIRHAVCPETPVRRFELGDSGIAVVVGRVLNPETDNAVVDARVTLTWIETAFDIKGLRVHSYTRETTSDRAGEFHFCALPSGLVGNLRATAGTGTQLVVERELDLGQRILTITTLHLLVLPPELATPRGVQAAAQAVLTGSVVRPDGSPLAAATAFVQGTTDSAFTDDLGTFKNARAAEWDPHGHSPSPRVRAGVGRRGTLQPRAAKHHGRNADPCARPGSHSR